MTDPRGPVLDSGSNSLARRLWRIAFLTQGIIAGAAWWLLPGGFPLDHIKFWSNQVALPLIAIAMIAACYADVRGKATWLAALSVATAGLWLVGGLASAALFPASMVGKGIGVALLGAIALAGTRRTMPHVSRWRSIAAYPLAAILGIVLVGAQRGAAPGTQPERIGSLPSIEGEGSTTGVWQFADPAGGAAYVDLQGRVDLTRGPYRLGIEPLLTFESRSIDRGWTLFARPEDRLGPPRRVRFSRHTPNHFLAEFGPAEPARLEVLVRPGERSLEIDGQVELPGEVYSHLNSYGTIFLAGHKHLEVEFSPCPGQWIEPVPHEYPFGLPLRLGTMYHDGAFRVVQAASAEKGPFTTLAEGTLAPGDPLTVTFRDSGQPFVALRFEDWSGQASTELSPTAGWGLPQNEILFARANDSPASPVFFGLTLASTSTGRGFESVGHAAGVYRNRIRVTWLDAAGPQTP